MSFGTAWSTRIFCALVAFVVIGIGIQFAYQQLRASSGPHAYFIVFTVAHVNDRAQTVTTMLTSEGPFSTADACNRRLKAMQGGGADELCVEMRYSDAAAMTKAPF
jgi:hypothetical protein